MGFLVSLSETIGFWIGIPIGILLGFFIFIYYEPRDVKDFGPNKSLEDYDSSTLIDLLPKLPLWVMNPDYERVDWLNKFINDMWPYFDKVACGIIISTAEPIFSEYIDKFQIKSINFEHLTLGNLPPKIHGLKVQESNENQLVFDLALRWAGNAVIVLAIKLFSLEINVQLIDIQISAATRVILRPFVPTFPCFANIAVSLMEKPQIDFGLKVMRGDIMAIPGLYQCVQEVISKQVAGLYLWPHTYEIPILDSSIGADKKPVGILHVKVVRAQNLLNTDFLSMSDPYVKLSLSGERLPAKKTSVKMNNLNPEWLEDFKMIVKDPQSQVLQMHLYDWEKFGAHDYLGMQVIPLNVLIPYEKKDFTLSLLNSMDPDDPHNKKPRGQITVATAFIPFLEDSKKFSGIMDYEQNGSSHDASEKISLTGTGLLIVTIIGAEDVEGKNHNNPHAVILFRGDKRKTKSIKKTRNPIWNEEFQFVLEEAPVKDQIHIEVISKRRSRLGFMSKEPLGHVDINLSDVVYNGHINERCYLINSRDGVIHVDIGWKVI
ncbi:synaptotagmin-3-like [Olea europaea var. sylvestris]|uniref:Synaptotagmin-3-like isoform X1 n=1 Tax=Olea europaea subsp. europaea TaxID=158383 RepID=A0A8S0QLU8_OLEEU|nr:synaptotagmin-3-like [Olea europaea var. sylvestris]CAA2969031.1 synaptotagmin-3-like isoform X1 [Olea europaea subsp. europaea]